ncbi:unnamed protein product [Auanema sp. JU1783]|nr:unnamed protein product [Auanema sp. JU1783]
MQSILGPVGKQIYEKLRISFTPKFLEVVCESHLHNVPKGSEKHFLVRVVSDRFEGCTTLQRHRLVNDCLSNELKSGVHALRIEAFPTSKWAQQDASSAPTCRGGFGL